MSAGNGVIWKKRYEQPEDAKKDQKKSKENDEATGLEKILTGLGVAAAVIIVAVVIVFYPETRRPLQEQHAGRSDGAGLPGGDHGEAKTTAVSETTISQKEVYMPNLVGHSQDEAGEDSAGTRPFHAGGAGKIPTMLKRYGHFQKEKTRCRDPARFSKVTVVISAGSDKVDLAELGLFRNDSLRRQCAS